MKAWIRGMSVSMCVQMHLARLGQQHPIPDILHVRAHACVHVRTRVQRYAQLPARANTCLFVQILPRLLKCRQATSSPGWPPQSNPSMLIMSTPKKVCTCMYIHAYTHIHAHLYTFTHTHTHPPMYTRTRACARTHARMHGRTDARTHQAWRLRGRGGRRRTCE